ncbi:MAG: hypothetical protein O3A96_14070 [Proteobacteria bacterium]|nr:hypothetical protein [Pseudomonadota bacterium]
MAVVSFSAPGMAEDFVYNESVDLKVGESLILKGVRGRECEDSAPAWSRLADRFPSSDLGTLSDGGAGFTDSGRCKGRVAARGIKFTATKPGTETLEIYNDEIRITVN